MNKKTISRTILLLAILLLCTAMGTFYYVKLELREKNEKIDLFSLIPEESEAIVEVNDIHSLFQSLHYTAFAKLYNQLQFSDLIHLLDNRFNDLDKQKAHGLSGQMNHLLISFHAPGGATDQVIYGHLGNEDQDFIESLLKQTTTLPALHKEVMYQEEPIHLYPLNNEQFLACYFQKGFYAISFQKKLIEKVIDTYRKRMPSMQDDSEFAKLSTEQKVMKSLYLYVRNQPLSNWAEFNILIHDKAIYMAGNYADSSSTAITQVLTEGKKVNLIADHLLPEKTLLFYQRAISDGDSILSRFRHDSIGNSLHSAFSYFFQTYAKGEMNCIEFKGNGTDCIHRLFLFPLVQTSANVESAWKNAVQTVPQYKQINGKGYLIYPLLTDTLMEKFLTPSHVYIKKALYTTLHDRKLLISDKPDDLLCYVQMQTDRTEKPFPYQKEMDDLSQEPNFTLFTDLEQILSSPQEYTRFIPPFFFNHKEFFKNFTFSLQLIKSPERINANVILDYKKR